MVMGGLLATQSINCEDFLESYSEDFETYFRPSNLPVLNTRILSHDLLDKNYGKKPEEISLPDGLLDTPENTILNFYSILRDAANPVADKSAGCGTIGLDKTPYPTSYQFLSYEYQQNLSYESYLKSYENILHINLIKFHPLPLGKAEENAARYFVELETIEGTDKEIGVFAYYYGFVDLKKEKNQFKITNIYYFGENFLCAPYHGWHWDAESNVAIRYGDWCKLIQGDIQKSQTDDIVRIIFDGTDGYQYCIVFFQLTNSTDLEVAQYRKLPGGTWKPITITVEECLENKKSTAQ
ncbi:hypothetical protein CLNEO_17090 [Anaerotignum neopropionicum]|uniref:Uncharacterized protein n=1 Tax=Anaerotignum neopropionicum TaxID=36847 RepID=A0A136WDT9_9FIRM|nr:hypothetical protein [Anaerotignum neopropionicum]KXL52688.1 hypothetical protein CLNEO_17090 [Anaerotignum neopropionicum]